MNRESRAFVVAVRPLSPTRPAAFFLGPKNQLMHFFSGAALYTEEEASVIAQRKRTKGNRAWILPVRCTLLDTVPGLSHGDGR